MIYPEQLTEIAEHYVVQAETVEDLCAAGLAYVQSFAFPPRDKSLKMLAWQMMLPSVTAAKRPLTPEEAEAPSNVRLLKEAEAITLLAHSISNDLGIKERHPHARIGTGTRSYNFSSIVDGERRYYSENLFSGEPMQWPEGFKGELKRACATPGIAMKNGLASYSISDRPEDEMVLAPCCALSKGQAVNFENPVLDLNQ